MTKKICYFYANYHLAEITGQPALVEKLISKAKESSYQVSVVSNALQKKQFIKNNVNYFLVAGNDNFRSYAFNLIYILKILIKIRPDVIHVNGLLMCLYVWIMARFLRIKLFSLISETTDKISPLAKIFFSFISRDIKTVFTTCNYIKGQLIKFGVNENKIKVVRIGLDQKFLKSNQKDEQLWDIFYFGDSNYARGFDIVVKLAQRLKKFKFLFSIRFQEKECEKEINIVKNLTNAKLSFYPQGENLHSMLSKSKIVVLPYRWMLIRPPISLLEALAAGNCVITSHLPGNSEIINNKENGILINFKQLHQVSKIIKSLVNNYEKRMKMGTEAKKTITKIYTSKEYSKIIDYYAHRENSQ